jgi:asparagine synthase (glutamine-hydrolysing)
VSTTYSSGIETDDFVASISPSKPARIVGCGLEAGSVRRVAIVGHHFVAEPELNAAVDKAEQTGDITALSSKLGSCSVVLSHDGGLSAYADPVGQFPLFSARVKDRVLVGSSATALAAEVGAAIDPVSLAACIACPDTPDLFPARTMFRHVRRIPEGTVMRADDRGVRHAEYRRINAGHRVSVADAAERLRDRLTASVRARVNTADRLTADFSGGFDSTSLAFLAAAGDVPVDVFTSYHEGGPAGSDDVERARQYASLNPALTHHLVLGTAEHLPFQNLVAAGDEPHVTPIFLGALRARLAVARDLGADVHLVGEGGDVVLGAPPVYLADLIRSGDLATAWQHCVTWARLRTRSPLTLFRRASTLAATSRRQALLALARDIQYGRPAGQSSWEDSWLRRWTRPRADWLTARARRELAAGVRELADQETGSDSIADLVTRSMLRGQTLTQRAVRDAGSEFGISVHAPFLDADVVRACLSLPAHRRVDLSAPKPLLRRALSHLIPKAVLSHPAKGDYSKETYHGVRRAAPALRRLLADSAAADHGLLEPGPVRVVLDNAIQGLPTPWASLNQVFAVELWLREVQGKAVPK